MKCSDCKDEAVEGRVRCQRHLDLSKEKVKRSQRKNRDKGLCQNDGRPLAEGCKFCRRCLDKAWARTQPRKKELKHRAVELLGGHCVECNFECPKFPEVFDFHHLDPIIKEDKVSSLIARGRSWEEVETEVLKCVLLCANCHRIRHAKESQ